jgi:hypothetical protein
MMTHRELSGAARTGLCSGHFNGLGDIHELWPIQQLGRFLFKMSRTAKIKWVGCQLAAATGHSAFLWLSVLMLSHITTTVPCVAA